MKKIGLIALIMGVWVLLTSSGAGAVSIGLVDGNQDSNITLTFTNLVGLNYKFGYINGNNQFQNIAGLLPVTTTFTGVSQLNFALQSRSNPLLTYQAATVNFLLPASLNVFHSATLDFTNIGLPVVDVNISGLLDGITPVTPSPEPATLLLLSSIMVVGYGTLHKKLRNRKDGRVRMALP